MPQRPGHRQTGPWQTADPRPGPPRSAAPQPPAPAQADYAGSQRGYPDRQRHYGSGRREVPYEEPWPDDSRGPQLDGPWWDPDSWPDWRRWLIPVGVAVLAAAIGAALVLLTGLHPGASAASGALLRASAAR